MPAAQTALFHFVAVAFVALVLGESALTKLVARETPEWFIGKFRDTWLARIGPPLPAQWWAITAAELAVVCCLIAGLVTGEFLPGQEPLLSGFGLLGAAAVFAVLNFGLRVSGDFVGATHAFVYGFGSLVLWYLIGASP
jgi:hypothetical protein